MKSFDDLWVELSKKAIDRPADSATVAALDAGVHGIGKKIIEEAATDKYSYLRDAFMQNRLNLINEGAPPPGLDVEDPAESDDKK